MRMKDLTFEGVPSSPKKKPSTLAPMKQAWLRIATCLNAEGYGPRRSEEQLKKIWERIKINPKLFADDTLDAGSSKVAGIIAARTGSEGVLWHPASQNLICDKTKVLYDQFHTEEGGEGEVSGEGGASAGGSGDTTKKEFNTSKGWFENFKKRYNLHNLRITGKSTLADGVAAREYPATFAEIIREKGYKPEHVFNADETGLWWKKMPATTFISKGFKVAKERVSLLLCGNAAGHMIKPMLLYHAKLPYALKNKDMHLPLFYRHNKKAWMMALLFTERFHNCFVREVKDQLQEKGFKFKVLLMIDNCSGHPKALKVANKNVEVIFLPQNTKSLLQPLHQGVITVFKAKYMTHTFSRIQQALDEDTRDGAASVREMWNKFSFADCISFMTALCVNSCWRALWPEVVYDFGGFHTVNEDVQHIVQLAR
ncbi:tigger transposable element-derived protein 1-like [Homarus americanus]|uniref:tigger transposable element-derived protein 1-like n=1 Tax=Homarus americanus TaxID=6706 RepID=UPI001C46EC3E|nr:tigger transposable element-derived protein 1-like [Homarus americanus]